MSMKLNFSLLVLLFCYGTAQADQKSIDECMLKAIQQLPNETPISHIKDLCTPKVATDVDPKNIKETGIVEERLEIDKSNVLKPYTLMSHNQNYFLLAAYNFVGWNTEEIEEQTGKENITLDDTEAQFQLSIKTPLAIDILGSSADLYAAYTLRSFWQVYNSEASSPFRESNHEPEAWLQLSNDFEIFGFRNSANSIGFAHQSNGQSGSYSRSWNRIYAMFGFEKENFAFALKPWLRIAEDSETDDNPDITDYLGHGELKMAYKHDDHVFSLMTRNNLESGFSTGAIELGWSFPLFDYEFLKGYIQYFSGYGESLIDYDSYNNRIGAGIILTDIF